MNKKHKNYEWIVAFAEGKAVQWRGNDLGSAWDGWEDFKTRDFHKLNEDCFMFRLKPEVRKTVGYRQYYMETDGAVFPCTLLEDTEWMTPDDIEANTAGFLGWKHKEWQYDIVEEA